MFEDLGKYHLVVLRLIVQNVYFNYKNVKHIKSGVNFFGLWAAQIML